MQRLTLLSRGTLSFAEVHSPVQGLTLLQEVHSPPQRMTLLCRGPLSSTEDYSPLQRHTLLCRASLSCAGPHTHPMSSLSSTEDYSPLQRSTLLYRGSLSFTPLQRSYMTVRRQSAVYIVIGVLCMTVKGHSHAYLQLLGLQDPFMICRCGKSLGRAPRALGYGRVWSTRPEVNRK